MTRSDRQILLTSIAILMLELLFIRWIGTEISIFAYLQNTVLVTCFIGFGLGCLRPSATIAMRDVLLAVLGVVVLLSIPPLVNALNYLSSWLGVFEDPIGWAAASGLRLSAKLVNLAVGLTICGAILWMCLSAFIPLGGYLAYLLNASSSVLRAYGINLLGSLLGIWLFVLFSYLSLPPWIWVGSWLLIVLLITPHARLLALSGCILLVPLLGGLWEKSDKAVQEVVWSPYQKLNLIDLEHFPSYSELFKFWVKVNHNGYQVLSDLRYDPANPGPESKLVRAGYTQYDLPFRIRPEAKSALLLGAGAGNDSAAAVRAGVERIVAVEIDPEIIRFGRNYHPESPYKSDRIEVINDDARSYLASAKEQFEIISFGLLDSHTNTAMTNARLDHYVYTRESIELAKQRLAPGGMLALTFEAFKPYILDRMARVLREVFGEEAVAFRIPKSHYGFGGVMFLAGGRERILEQISSQPVVREFVSRSQREFPQEFTLQTPMTTDDWPYLYLEAPRIPTLYYLLAAALLILFFLGARRVRLDLNSTLFSRDNLQFVSLGAAFMLLEALNVSRLAVLFGATWLVNAIVISGVLAMCILANLLAAKWAPPRRVIYACLMAACLAQYFVDLSYFADLEIYPKIILAALFVSAPVFFAGLVFSSGFAGCANKGAALGANMFGAVIGGVLQSATFLTGIKALIILFSGFYLVAALSSFTALQIKPRRGESHL